MPTLTPLIIPTTQAAPTEAATPAVPPTPIIVFVTPTPVVTPAATGPATYQVGDVISVAGADLEDLGFNTTTDTRPWAKITVTEAKVVASYGKSSYDAPKTAGDVFLQVKVTYEALHDGVGYNPLDFTLYVDGTAVDRFAAQAHVLDGPTQLSSGTLPSGRKATGYIVYEVPPKGEVRMAYGYPGDVFEIIIRTS